MEKWLPLIQSKNKRQIARVISHIENDDAHREAILEEIYPATGHAFLIGLTGPPGAGKSSLLGELIGYLRSLGLTVGVIAVDPTSPFTGGAILGDRVRMTRHTLDEGVFIRSMGSRGSLGGLSRATKEAIWVLDAAGYDVIVVETVGVGQAELEIMHVVDSVTLVLNPHAGDVVQVFKAGIMEIADVFVINKSDLPGAARLKKEIEDLLHLSKPEGTWCPPIVETVATVGKGIDQWWSSLEAHRRYLLDQGEWLKKRQRQLENEVRDWVKKLIQARLEKWWEKPEWNKELQEVLARKKTPYQTAYRLVQDILPDQGGGK